MENTIVTLGSRSIPLAIRHHKNARRITLRISAAKDGIVMTLPIRASLKAGMAFFHSKSAWILANIESDAQIHFASGIVIPIMGKEYTICHHAGRGISELKGNDLLVFGSPEFLARRVKDFLKKHLQRYSLVKAHNYAGQINKTVRLVKVREAESRWGSCSPNGVLNFNWRLVFAPLDIIDYLIAHEVAHLAEMNHSDRFWAVVNALCPNADAAHKWLRRYGHQLHRYG